jgi:tetratricopeptide (TPR) repeat protein
VGRTEVRERDLRRRYRWSGRASTDKFRAARRLGKLLEQQDRGREQIEFLRAAQRESRRWRGAGDKWTVALEIDLANALRNNDELSEAMELARDALRHAPQATGDELELTADAQMSIGLCFMVSEDDAEAESVLRNAVEGYEKAKMTGGLVAARFHLGMIYLTAKRQSDARWEFAAAVDAAEAGDHDSPASRYSRVGRDALDLENGELSKVHELERCFDQLLGGDGRDRIMALRFMPSLIRFLREQGRVEEAQTWASASDLIY